MRGVQMVIIAVGGILLFWFFAPLLCKGIFNIGTATGILISLFLLCYGIFFGRMNRRALILWNGRKTHWICVFLLVLVLIMIMTVLAETFLMIHSALHTPPQNTTAVVLGCSVKGTKPSRILEERIDAAYDYLSVNKDAVCILSGGRGPGEDITEAQCMYNYLTENGVDGGRLILEETATRLFHNTDIENRLILEERSTTTEENLKYTGEILKDRGLDMTVTLVTSEFHEYRANQMAARLGMKSYSTPAHTFFVYFPTYYVRELYGILYYELRHWD